MRGLPGDEAREDLLGRREGEIVQEQDDVLPVDPALGVIAHDQRRSEQELFLQPDVRMHPVGAGMRQIKSIVVALTGAQRRLRQLGMLAAVGATERHLRLVLLADGAVVGVLAALAGTGIGLTAWIVAAPHLEEPAGHRIDPWQVPWWLVVGGMLLAVVTALAAAWWPARAISRIRCKATSLALTQGSIGNSTRGIPTLAAASRSSASSLGSNGTTAGCRRVMTEV